MSDVAQAAAQGIQEAIRWSAVGIVCGGPNRRLAEVGSGTLVRWLGRHSILTADHVIRGTAPEDLRFVFRNDEPLHEVEWSDLRDKVALATPSLQRVQTLEIPAAIASDERLDLAAIPVDSNLESKYPVRFFDMTPGGVAPTEGTTVLAVGYPSDIARATANGEGVIFTACEWSNVVPPRTLKDFDPNLHFLFPFRTGEDDSAAHPRGISGSAVWFRRSTPPPGLWQPNIDIGGVTLAYYPASRLLLAAQRPIVEQFLREKCSPPEPRG